MCKKIYLLLILFGILTIVSTLDAQNRKIAHWSFDDCSGIDSGYVRMDGSLSGNPLCIKGIRGNSYRFDGVDDCIGMGNDILIIPRDTISITAWVRRDNEGLAAILTKFENSGDMEWWFGLYDGEIHFTTQNTGGCGGYCSELMSSKLEIPKDVWTWIGVIIEGNKVSYMMNGKIIDSDYNNYDFKHGKSIVQIGRKNTNWLEYDYYKGDLDEVIVYEGALTPKHIEDIYNDYKSIEIRNYYTPVINIQDNILEVFDISECQIGDKILVIQMQGASVERQNSSEYGSIKSLIESGNYEFNQIKQIGGKTGKELILERPLINKYALSGNIQVVGIPYYTNVIIKDTITCPKWNGQIGGVFALYCENTIELQAPIDVSGKGFSGGIAKNSDSLITENVTNFFQDNEKGYLYSFKGQGISTNLGLAHLKGKGAMANGGGGGNSHNAGGGGGANGGCGGIGGMGYKGIGGKFQESGGIGGYAITTAQNKAFMGGGGGAGHGNEKTATNGGDGGGIIFLISKELRGINGKLISNGTNALNSQYDGAGGGGAGGTILLKVGKIQPDIQIEIKGGNGGNVTVHLDGPGGGGGGGVFQVNKNWMMPKEVALKGGYSGVQTDLSSYGASNGCSGATLGEAAFTGDNTNLILQVHEDNQLSNQEVLAVYPNPTEGIVTFSKSNRLCTYKIINVLGMVLLEGKLTNDSVNIDLSGIDKGVYFIEIFDSIKYRVVKIIKN